MASCLIIVTNEIETGLYICADTQAPSFYHQYIIWLPVIVFDGVLCVLALWYGISHWMSGYRAMRIDGVYIADALIKGHATYFFWYALSPLLRYPNRSIFLRQHNTGVYRQHRYRAIFWSTYSPPT